MKYYFNMIKWLLTCKKQLLHLPFFTHFHKLIRTRLFFLPVLSSRQERIIFFLIIGGELLPRKNKLGLSSTESGELMSLKFLPTASQFHYEYSFFHLANICSLPISLSVRLTMGNMNVRVSLGQYSLLHRCSSHRQPHLRQHVLVFCRLNKITSPVLASQSIIGNSFLQSLGLNQLT